MSFECPKSIKSIKKNNTWNIRLLVDDSFVPSSKQPSVIYCRLTDFLSIVKNQNNKGRNALPEIILPNCVQLCKILWVFSTFLP